RAQYRIQADANVRARDADGVVQQPRELARPIWHRRERRLGGLAHFSVSKIRVMGPSFVSVTAIWVRNRPVSTVTPRWRHALQKASNSASARTGSMAPPKLGRRP